MESGDGTVKERRKNVGRMVLHLAGDARCCMGDLIPKTLCFCVDYVDGLGRYGAVTTVK